MKRLPLTMMILIAAHVCRGNPIEPDDPTKPVVRANNEFAFKFYARLRDRESGNLFFSPHSVSTALSMALAGARGETERQMAEVLRLDLPREQRDKAVGLLLARMNAVGRNQGYRLSVANRLWGARGLDFLPEYLDLTRTVYGAELGQLDFASHAEESRRTINAWVASKTENKILDLVPPGSLNSSTKLVLTNAIYFKGIWSSPFPKGATRKDVFHVKAGEDVSVPLMFRRDHFRVAAVDGLKALELTYGKGDLAMVVLLPDKADGLSALEAKLTPANLDRWLSRLKHESVLVHLPRFKQTSPLELGADLRGLGMTLPFSDQADFSGMDRRRDIVIGRAIHKAYVDVNEEGTEAAAATGVVMHPPGPIEPPPVVFRADHPFVFLIRDQRTGSILFLGRLTKPEA